MSVDPPVGSQEQKPGNEYRLPVSERSHGGVIGGSEAFDESKPE